MLIVQSVVAALVIDWVAGRIGVSKLALLGVLAYVFGWVGLVFGIALLGAVEWSKRHDLSLTFAL